MVLQEVLQLDKIQSSIKKIDLFLVSQVKFSDDYMKAYAYKALIFHTIGKTNEALKLLFGMVPSFKEMNIEGVIAICDGIIDICLELKRYDQVNKYIAVKKGYLPISMSICHIKDTIKYSLAIKKYDDAKIALQKYLADDLTLEESIYAKEELSKIYYSEHQYEKFLDLIPGLETYYQTNLIFDKLADLEFKKIKISFEQGNYLKVIQDGKAFLKDEGIKKGQILSCAAILIRSFLIMNDYKWASITESDYCDLVSEEYLEESIEFCYAGLEVYTKSHTVVQMNNYETKIKELESFRKQEKVEQKKKNKKEEIVIPVLPNEEEEEIAVDHKQLYIVSPKIKDEVGQKIESKATKIKNIVVSENYEKLTSIFSTLHELDPKIKFRELFRMTCIKLCEVFPIEEVYFLYFRRKYYGIHYKKERAYDKKLEFDDIEGTINYAAMNYEQDIFLDPEDTEFTKNIITFQPYEQTPYGLAVSLNDNLQAIGSIAYFAKDPFLDKEMVYESLKLISSMLNNRLLQWLNQDAIEFNNSKLFFVYENMSSGFKEEMDGYLHFSKEACKILGVLEDMVEEDYFSKMKTSDIMEYRKIHEKLYTQLNQTMSLEYDFKKGDSWIRIRERYYPMLLEGVVCILSLIDDITALEKNKNDLIDLAYTNPISKLDTEVKLMVDLPKFYQNKKLSLAIIDVIDFNLYRELYGYNFTNQLIFTIGKELKQITAVDFNTYVYHLEVDRFVILFNDVNDKRAIDSKLNSIFKEIHKNIYELNFRVSIYFNAGVYRLARHANLEDPAMILYYAYDALSDAKDLEKPWNHIAHYDSDLHKKKFNENQLITHISESIDHGKLGLTYKQIVHISKNEVYGYAVSLNLDNYEVDIPYMEYVVNRRGLTTQIEKYAVSNAMKELKMFKDTLKGYILCFLQVSKVTLEENFVLFIENQKNFYKVPNDYIALIVENANSPVVIRLRELGYKIVSKNLIDVYANRCDFLFYDYHNSKDSTGEIIELCLKHNVTCIVTNIDTKEDLVYAKEHGYEYIYGDYYKKLIRMKGLIEKMHS